MSGSIVWEWNFWISSIAIGFIMTFVYDTLRLFRKLIPHNLFWIDIEDIFYWIACFFITFTWLYYDNNGVIRFIAVIGAGVGMGIYSITVGQFYVKYISFLTSKLIARICDTTVRIITNLHKLLIPVNRIFTGVLGNSIKKNLFANNRLTEGSNHHKIDIRTSCSGKSGKGEIEYAKKSKKNAGIFARKK